MNDYSWLRDISALRMILTSDQVAMLEPNSSVVKEELELRDRGELLRRLALSSAQLDTVLSVAVYVIIYKLLKSGDVENNPGPENLDYNSVDGSTILDDNDLPDVMEEVISIHSKFYDLGRSLRLKIHDLKRILDAYPSESDSRRALEDVLLLWLDHKYDAEKYGRPTWQMLAIAVDMKSGGNDQELAKQIACRHPAIAGNDSTRVTKDSKEHTADEEVTQKDRLTTNDMREVIDTLYDYRAKWRLIGIQMGIKPGDLDAIGKNKDVDDALIDISKQWLRSGNPKPNRAMLTAIIESKCIAGGVTSAQGFVEIYAEYLKLLYKAQTLASSSDDDQWPPPCTDKVFRLAMIKNEEMGKGHIGDDAILREKTISGKVDNVLQRMDAVEIKDIFTVKNPRQEVKEVKKVLMEGAPGSGKSTLSFHICRQWVEGHLFQEYEVVILVRLREPAIQTATSLMELLPRRNEAMEIEIKRTITDGDGKEVLLILDGWDELPCNVPAYSMLLEVMKGKKLPAITIIVTSRPTSSAILHRLAHRQVEILGFTKDELQQYFTKCLENNDEAVHRLLQRIKQNPIVEGSCYLPLNASILVHLFKHSGHVLPTTQYGIFTELVCTCIYRHLRKTHQDISELESLEELPPSTAAQFRHLCRVAYDGVMQDKVIFDLGPNFNTLGLLQCIESFAKRGKSYSYNFLHLSIQELLCALHMANELDEREQAEQFKKLFGQPRFMLAFQFFAAKTKLQTSEIREIVTQLAKKCSGDSPSRQDKTLLVSLMHCLFEAQDSSLCRLVTNELNHKLIIGTNGNGIRLDPTDCYYLGYFLTFCDGFDVNLSYCSIGVDHCKSLFRSGEFYNFRSLSLASNDIGDEGAIVVAAAMKTATNLQKLFLRANAIGREGAMAVATAMKTATNLQVLYLQSNDIGDEGAMAVATAMKTATNLQELFLGGNAIGNEGAMAVAAAMKTAPNLQKLNLGGNGIDREGKDTIKAVAKKTGTKITIY